MIVYDKLYIYSSRSGCVNNDLYGTVNSAYKMFLLTSEEDRDFLLLKGSISDDRPMYVLYPRESGIKEYTGKVLKFHGRPVLIPVNLNTSGRDLIYYRESSAIGSRMIRREVMVESAGIVSSGLNDAIPSFLIQNPLALIEKEDIKLDTPHIMTGNDVSIQIWKLRNKIQIHSLKSMIKADSRTKRPKQPN